MKPIDSVSVDDGTEERQGVSRSNPGETGTLGGVLAGVDSAAFARELDELRAENARLRKLLNLTTAAARAAAPGQPSLPVSDAGIVTMDSSSEAKVRLFQSLFRTRTDVFAVRWENPRDGRSGWVPSVAGGWRRGMAREGAAYQPLTAGVVAEHLLGTHHIGLYPLTDDDRCWWVAADFDKDAAMLDALAYVKASRARGVPAALEIS